MKVPKLGNIWINGSLVGFRDFITGVFTPVVGFESYALVDDVFCPNSNVVENNEIAVYQDGELVTHTVV